MDITFIKEKQFSIVGTTQPLSDGVARPFTIVAILTENQIEDNLYERKVVTVGNKTIHTTVVEDITYKQYVLELGLAITSPADLETATPEQGIAIAKGKARKVKSQLLQLTTNTKGYFTKAEIERILAEQARRVSYNPEKFVKISPKAKS